MQYRQIWCTLNRDPALPPGTLESHKQLFENVVFPVGNIIDGRYLVSTMTNDWPTVKAALESYGKVIVECGAIDSDGYFTDDVAYNPAEFDKHMHPVDDGQGNIIQPTDFTTSGYVGFKEGQFRPT